MRKLKARWEITSNWQLIVIFIVFSVTGSTAAKLGEPLTLLLGISKEFWLFWPVRIVIVFPIYQLILVLVGWLYGEFLFFWNFEKKMLQRMGIKSFVKA